MLLSQVVTNNATALAACQSGDWSAARAALLADTVTVNNPELRTTRWLMVEFSGQADGQAAGTTEADVILGTLQASTNPRVKAAYDAMSSTGIDLSDDQVQAMLPLLSAGASWPSGLADRFAQRGRYSISKAEQANGSEPSEAEIKTAYEAGQVSTFDRKALLLSVNRKPNGKTAVSIQSTEVGTSAGGDDVKGAKTAVSVADASQPHSDAKVQALLEAINSAITSYLS